MKTSGTVPVFQGRNQVPTQYPVLPSSIADGRRTRRGLRRLSTQYSGGTSDFQDLPAAKSSVRACALSIILHQCTDCVCALIPFTLPLPLFSPSSSDTAAIRQRHGTRGTWYHGTRPPQQVPTLKPRADLRPWRCAGHSTLLNNNV